METIVITTTALVTTLLAAIGIGYCIFRPYETLLDLLHGTRVLLKRTFWLLMTIIGLALVITCFFVLSFVPASVMIVLFIIIPAMYICCFGIDFNG